MAWASCSNRQEDTPVSIITVGEGSDDDKRHGNTTENANCGKEVPSSVGSWTCREQVLESNKASLTDRCRSVCCFSEYEHKAYHLKKRSILSLFVKNGQKFQVAWYNQYAWITLCTTRKSVLCSL